MQFDRVHPWLASTYWSPGISREKVERAAGHSALVVGAFADDVQCGYARIVSDQTTFAWVCDVFVDEAFRGRGLARRMITHAMQLPEFQGLRRWLLATADAHGVYAAIGFEPLPNPERWMVRRPN
jgi:GNAT superfamily N-acetyltransferase